MRQAPKVWVKVVEMMEDGEMPPKKKPQLTAAERKAFLGWIRKYLDAEALANAGDPGRVVLRRLSNAEYTYTIQDLTGVKLTPAREFPVDGAAGEGFMNVGDAMAMSPALVQKYLDAGKEVASHAVLTPKGIRFRSAPRAVIGPMNCSTRFAPFTPGTPPVQGLQIKCTAGIQPRWTRP